MPSCCITQCSRPWTVHLQLLAGVFSRTGHGKSILLQCSLPLLVQGEVMRTGQGADVAMGKARTSGEAQLSFFSLIWTVLFPVVFAAIKHGGPEDSEERIVPVPLWVTALITATVPRRPAKCKRPFLTCTGRAMGFPKMGMAGGGRWRSQETSPKWFFTLKLLLQTCS